MIIAFIVGLVLGLMALVKSTDWFLDKAIAIFTYFKFSPFVVGVLVVGFGTSLPEWGIGVMAALGGDASLALSSAVGSNVANISLVFGVTLFLVPGTIGSLGHHKAAGFLVLVSALLLLLSYWGGGVSVWDGWGLLALFVGFLWVQLRARSVEPPALSPEETPDHLSWVDYLKLAVFLTCVLLSSQGVVWCALGIADYFQVSGTYVGLTLVALGSSLPELVSSVMAVKKKQIGLVLGNVIGSNTMNSLMVVGSAVVITPISPVEDSLLHKDLPWALVLAVMLWFFAWKEVWKNPLPRKILGTLWLLSYLYYVLRVALQVAYEAA